MTHAEALYELAALVEQMVPPHYAPMAARIAATLKASEPAQEPDLCVICERPLGDAVDACPHCGVKFVRSAQERCDGSGTVDRWTGDRACEEHPCTGTGCHPVKCDAAGRHPVAPTPARGESPCLCGPGRIHRPNCGKYLGDNDGTCPQLTCVRNRGHDGPCDNVRGESLEDIAAQVAITEEIVSEIIAEEQAEARGEAGALPPVIEFLRGSGQLDGAWWGDPTPIGKRPYWWRSVLQREWDDLRARLARESRRANDAANELTRIKYALGPHDDGREFADIVRGLVAKLAEERRINATNNAEYAELSIRHDALKERLAAAERSLAEAERNMNEHIADKHRILREYEAQAQVLRQKLTAAERARKNHAETLIGIASMDPSDGKRMRMWAKDGLSGYKEPVESTVAKLSDERNAAVQRAEAAERDLAESRNAWSLLNDTARRYREAQEAAERRVEEEKP